MIAATIISTAVSKWNLNHGRLACLCRSFLAGLAAADEGFE